MNKSCSTGSQSGPPLARLAFRVGTVGHRPNRLQQADLAKLTTVLQEVLAVVKDTVTEFPSQDGNGGLYSKGAPLMRVVSPLAEGTDRLFAEQALSLGYALCCPMPFFKDEYEKDFAPGLALEEHSVERFQRLLDQASQDPEMVTFELDGDRSWPGEAYGEAGRVVLNQSDLLVVIWDGGQPEGAGGTVQTLSEAVHFRVPVVRIDAAAPHCWDLMRSKDDFERLNSAFRRAPEPDTPPAWNDLRRTIIDILRPFSTEETAQSGPDLRAAFFSEHKPAWNFMIVWKVFRDLVDSGKLRIPAFRVQDFEVAVKKDWCLDPQEDVSSWTNRHLISHYAWSDKLADIYADRYRSSYVIAYLLAGMAVFLALVPYPLELAHSAPWMLMMCIVGEMVCLIAILGLWLLSNDRRWHDRWLQYRLLAESVRQLRLLIPLGGGDPSPRLPEHLAGYGDPSRSWMRWHVRALARAIGIPTAKVNKAYVAQSLSYLKKVAHGQMEFHEKTHRRARQIERRLHRLILYLLLATMASVVIHLFSHGSGLESWPTLFSAVLPALGAALAGIINQGEFARTAKRSEAMAKRLAQICDELGRLAQTNDVMTSSIKLAQSRSLVMRTAQLMVDELLDWHVIFVDRPSQIV